MIMDEKKRFVVCTLLLFAAFFFVGESVFDRADVSEEQIEGFMDSLGNGKSLNYFSKFSAALKNYDCMKIETTGKYKKERFFSISKGMPENIGRCPEQIKIKFNDHAIAGILYGSYNMNGALFSEFATGNLQIEGLSFGDMAKLL